jgi:hypothetical protein
MELTLNSNCKPIQIAGGRVSITIPLDKDAMDKINKYVDDEKIMLLGLKEKIFPKTYHYKYIPCVKCPDNDENDDSNDNISS